MPLTKVEHQRATLVLGQVNDALQKAWLGGFVRERDDLDRALAALRSLFREPVEHLAIRKEDARLMTPLDLLRDLLPKFEAGEENACQMVIVWMTAAKDAMETAVAGVDRPQSVTLLEVAKVKEIRAWLGTGQLAQDVDG